MKHKGPLVTLLAGLAVALVLLVLNINATDDKAGDSNASPAGAVGTAAPGAAPTTAAPTGAAPTPPAAKKQVTYAGSVNGASATIAIAINGGQAIAYLCDGKKLEAWLQGTADGGRLNLTGSNEGSLTGTYGNGIADGTVSAAGKSWTFRLTAVAPPSGVYRATANVRNARVVVGWIRLADGTVTGGLNVAGTSGPAPDLDFNTLTTVVDDTTLTATPVDGSGL